jgi:hypothetical protein
MNATDHTPCPVFPGVCTETAPGHVDHWNHDHETVDKRGERILDVGFVQVSDGAPAVIYIGNEDYAPEEVRAKTAEIRRLLDQADAMADQLLGQRALDSEKRYSPVSTPVEQRCQAAHPDDPTPCGGAPAVTVLDATNAGADGCQHHAARLLASIEGGRVYGLPHATPGTAIRVFKAAASIRPFCWLEDARRTLPSQLSRTENRCSSCHWTFDRWDTRPDGYARYAGTPFCRRCVDQCRTSTDLFHTCAACPAPGGEGQ